MGGGANVDGGAGRAQRDRPRAAQPSLPAQAGGPVSPLRASAGPSPATGRRPATARRPGDYRQRIEQAAEVLVPAVVLYEVYEWCRREGPERTTDLAAAWSRQHTVAPPA